MLERGVEASERRADGPEQHVRRDAGTDRGTDRHRERRYELVGGRLELGHSLSTPRHRRSSKQARNVRAGHLETAALPSLLLRARGGEGGRHLGGEHCVGRERHPLPREQQLHVQLDVLGEVVREPSVAEHVFLEHHPVAEEAGGQAERGAGEGPHVVAGGERGEAQSDAPRPAWVTDGVVGLDHPFASDQAGIHHPQEAPVEHRVGVDHHIGVVALLPASQAVQQPAQGRALARTLRLVSLVRRRAGGSRDVRGVVVTVVRDDVHGEEVGRIVDLHHAPHRVCDQRLLVVGGHKDGEAVDGVARRPRLMSPPSPGAPCDGRQCEQVARDQHQPGVHDEHDPTRLRRGRPAARRHSTSSATAATVGPAVGTELRGRPRDRGRLVDAGRRLAHSVHDGADGLGQDGHVEPHGPVLDVEEVEAAIHLEGRLVSCLDLPETGHPGLHLEAVDEPPIELGDLGAKRGSWTHEAHRPVQDVHELRQLVDAARPQEPSYRGDARIIAGLEQRPLALVERVDLHEPRFGIHAHRAELQDREGLTVTADPLLPEQDRPAVTPLDGDGRPEEQRRAGDESDRRSHDVERSLRRQLELRQGLGFHVDEGLVADGLHPHPAPVHPVDAAGEEDVDLLLVEAADQRGQRRGGHRGRRDHHTSRPGGGDGRLDVVERTEPRDARPHAVRIERAGVPHRHIAHLGRVLEEVDEPRRFVGIPDDDDPPAEVADQALGRDPGLVPATSVGEQEERREHAGDDQGRPDLHANGSGTDGHHDGGHAGHASDPSDLLGPDHGDSGLIEPLDPEPEHRGRDDCEQRAEEGTGRGAGLLATDRVREKPTRRDGGQVDRHQAAQRMKPDNPAHKSPPYVA